MSTKPYLNLLSLMFMSLVKTASAVDLRASSGHGKNQSIVVQFTKAGKVRNLRLNASPTGDIQITRCKFFLHYFTK